MHIESAKRGMCPLPRGALPIGVDHSRNTELIFLFVPTESHHHVRRVITFDLRVLETKCAFHRFLCENDSGKICLLQKFDEAANGRCVMVYHVKKVASAVPDEHDVSGVLLFSKFSLNG